MYLVVHCRMEWLGTSPDAVCILIDGKEFIGVPIDTSIRNRQLRKVHEKSIRPEYYEKLNKLYLHC